MRDREFKNFGHLLAPGDAIATRGCIIPGSNGYRPDISIKNPQGVTYLVLESERKSERKAFLGAMMQAARYSSTLQSNITLIFVMKETGNQTTVAQVSNNIRPYFQWLVALGATNLARVLMLSDEEYDESGIAGEVLLTPPFLARCTPL